MGPIAFRAPPHLQNATRGKASLTKRTRVAMAAQRKVSVYDARLPGSRGLRARVFYPSEVPEGTRLARWLPPSGGVVDETLVAVARFARLPAATVLAGLFGGLALRTMDGFAGGAVEGAGRFGVVLLSHGLGGSVSGYCAFCERVAAEGFVVVAVEHSDGSAFVARPQKGKIDYTFYNRAVHGEERAFRAGQLETRIEDVESALEALRAVDAGVEDLSPFKEDQTRGVPPVLAGRLNFDHVVLAGHSFGAATALTYCVRTPGIAKSVVCLDPWLWPVGDDAIAAADLRNTRALFVDQGLSNMTSSLALRTCLPQPSGTGCAVALQIPGGTHNNSSDFPLRLPQVVAVAGGMTARGSDPAALLEAQNSAAATFLTASSEQWQAYMGRVAALAVPGVLPAEVGVGAAGNGAAVSAPLGGAL